MDERDRRFFSWLGLIFGPLFVAGGFVAAFTIEGALFIWAGLALFAGALALRTPAPEWAAGALAGAIFLALSVYTLVVYP